MEKTLKTYQSVIDLLGKIVMTWAALVIGLDVLSIFLEAVSRYVIGSSRAFMEEVPRLLAPFIVFPMMGVLLRLKKHINVNILGGEIVRKYQAGL